MERQPARSEFLAGYDAATMGGDIRKLGNRDLLAMESAAEQEAGGEVNRWYHLGRWAAYADEAYRRGPSVYEGNAEDAEDAEDADE